MTALLGAILALCAAVPALNADAAAAIPKRPDYAVERGNCITAECHSAVAAYEVLHGPAGTGQCDACHRLTGAEEHTFAPAREKQELCTFCHEFDTGELPVIHKPVMTGECLGCHNPHGGTGRSFVREATVEKTCGRCHESVTFGKAHLHTPAGKDNCTGCHRPHASRYPMMLDAVGNGLCLSCHREFGEQMAAAGFLHKSMEEGCVRCHDPHGANHPMGITDALPGLCLECHENIKEKMEAAFVHPAASGERACLTCHTPHGGNLARLMRDLPAHVCMSCHDEAIEKPGGGIVVAMSEITDPVLFKHTPIREGQCDGCHSIHGGERALLLAREISTAFYEGFSEAKYGLCFGCHEEKLANRAQDPEATRFRNGDRNLHYVHVAAPDLGRNCRVCHAAHTTRQESLVRDWVLFGNWKMDIRFEKNETGGTCMTGCHPPYSYDRELPVASKTALSAAERAERVPRADKHEPTVVRWSAEDIGGMRMEVPDGNAPAVLLFLRAGQPQSARVVRMALAADHEIESAQVVAVFCGERAGEDARELAAESAGWRIAADAECGLAKRLGVEVWPATLIVRPDGVLLAHIAGSPPSLTTELEAYLDLAAGRIERETLAARLTKTGLVGDGPEKRAAWHLQAGRMLLAEGRPAEARTMFADGLKFQPESMDLKAGLLRALVELKEATEGLALLEQLPPEALAAWERDLLRGRLMAAQGRWDEARRLALAVLRERPDLGAAHFLMGTIYEHERAWELAAEEFRAASSTGMK